MSKLTPSNMPGQEPGVYPRASASGAARLVVVGPAPGCVHSARACWLSMSPRPIFRRTPSGGRTARTPGGTHPTASTHAIESATKALRHTARVLAFRERRTANSRCHDQARRNGGHRAGRLTARRRHPPCSGCGPRRRAALWLVARSAARSGSPPHRSQNESAHNHYADCNPNPHGAPPGRRRIPALVRVRATGMNGEPS